MPTWRCWGGRKTKTKPFPKWPMYDELEGRAQPHSWQAGFCCEWRLTYQRGLKTWESVRVVNGVESRALLLGADKAKPPVRGGFTWFHVRTREPYQLHLYGDRFRECETKD